MSEEFLKILSILEDKKCKKIGIFTHQNADPDSIASAIGLKYLLKNINPSYNINLYASSMSVVSKRLLTFHKSKFKNKLKEDLDALFLCDTNNPLQIGDIDINPLLEKKIPLFIIDHHSHHDFSNQAIQSIILPISSTAEIIASIFMEKNVHIPEEIATVLIAGIVFDSRRFIYLSPSTFVRVQFLIDKGGDYSKVLSLLHTPLSESEKIARLKGAIRTRLHREGSNIFALSYVSTFESSVARALIDLGSSCSIVIAEPPKGEFRISMRSTKEFASYYRINLGDIANKIGSKTGGSGGGHETAAGINVPKSYDLPSNKEECMDHILKLFLDEIKRE
ncbi:MAG: bifunctional oligoribonuclease/PAP phosphatase NrnA [Candidatus Thorarchaeota archaeon]